MTTQEAISAIEDTLLLAAQVALSHQERLDIQNRTIKDLISTGVVLLERIEALERRPVNSDRYYR